MNHNKFYSGLCKFDRKKPFDLICVFKYLLIHGFYSLGLIALSYLMFNSFFLHTLYVGTLMCLTTWNGSKKYFKMMTQYYEKAMKKAISEKINE